MAETETTQSHHREGYYALVWRKFRRSRIALLGILPPDTAIDWDLVIFNSLFIKGIYGREMFETWYKMTALIQSGLDVTPVLTHRFGIDDYEDGFKVMRSRDCGKVVLAWN